MHWAGERNVKKNDFISFGKWEELDDADGYVSSMAGIPIIEGTFFMTDYNLSIVLFQEEGYDSWVAQCLKYDIATQGRTIKLALDSLERTILGQIVLDIEDKKSPLCEIKPAPNEYLHRFRDALSLKDTRLFGIRNVSVSFYDIRISA